MSVNNNNSTPVVIRDDTQEHYFVVDAGDISLEPSLKINGQNLYKLRDKLTAEAAALFYEKFNLNLPPDTIEAVGDVDVGSLKSFDAPQVAGATNSKLKFTTFPDAKAASKKITRCRGTSLNNA